MTQTMETVVGAVGGNTYKRRLEQVKNYCESQGIPLDSRRARNYASSQGVDPNDLGVEIVETDTPPEVAEKSQRNYAKALGLKEMDPSVRKYAVSGTENEPLHQVDMDAPVDNEGYKATVLHYAQSQNLSVDHPNVVKYAEGLLKPTGDFSTERRSENRTLEDVERRIRETVGKYADRMNLLLIDPQVKRYEDGLRKGPYKNLLVKAMESVN